MTGDRHAPTGVSAVITQLGTTTCTIDVRWAVDTFWERSEPVQHWVVEVPGVASREFGPTEFSCSVSDVPLPALVTNVEVRVCGWWPPGPDTPAETQCDTAPLQLPARPAPAPPPPAHSDPPTQLTLQPLPRTLQEPARIAADWNGHTREYQYTYESGRDDLVDEITHDTSLVFPAAPMVTYRFSVRGRNPDDTRGAEEQWSPWVRAETSVGRPTSLRTFVGRRAGAGGVAALLLSRGVDPSSLREAMHA